MALSEGGILTVKNNKVKEINPKLLQQILEEFLAIQLTILDITEPVHNLTEFLNSLELSSIPPHKLQLKIWMPGMLFKNPDSPKLYNGTHISSRLIGSRQTALVE